MYVYVHLHVNEFREREREGGGEERERERERDKISQSLKSISLIPLSISPHTDNGSFEVPDQSYTVILSLEYHYLNFSHLLTTFFPPLVVCMTQSYFCFVSF